MFGYTAYAYIKQEKLEIRFMKGIFVGYVGVKRYKLWCSHGTLAKSIGNKDVVFNKATLLEPHEKFKYGSHGVKLGKQ